MPVQPQRYVLHPGPHGPCHPGPVSQPSQPSAPSAALRLHATANLHNKAAVVSVFASPRPSFGRPTAGQVWNGQRKWRHDDSRVSGSARRTLCPGLSLESKT